ncbi:hypothetical protein GCM10023081_46900 [Arthrobacter ginkgonis]|uniref:Uncharacterized protein n=1 Tax=Arthrobacter ginkgonis TaxID=1630594 RepID=A0ABP7DGW8_9MICC
MSEYTCKRACCWTPQGICATKYACPHHKAEERESARTAYVVDLDVELQRANTLTARRRA